jgi:hypothetical protein
MPGYHNFWRFPAFARSTPGALERRRQKTSLGPLASCEYDLPSGHVQPFQLRFIIQTQNAAFKPAAGRKFRHHRGQMPAGPLHPARGIQFWK